MGTAWSRNLGRYRLIRELSAGQDNRVYLAEDTRRGLRTCAVKILRVAGDRALEAAEREFGALRKLEHSAIAEVYDFGRIPADEARGLGLTWLAAWDPFTEGEERGSFPNNSAEACYIACAYYNGRNLRETFQCLFEAASEAALAEPASAGAWEVFIDAIAQTLEALHAIHSRGLIHYDIKPENLILVPRSSAGSSDRPSRVSGFDVKVLDFGLTEEDTTPLGPRARGTVPYIAPELLGAGARDHRCDLFSLGVTIFHAVTGGFPFPGDSPEAWLIAARDGRTRDLREARPDVPEPLAALVRALLEPDPDLRAPTAIDAIAILGRSGVAARPARRPTRRALPRVGWERELARVRREIESLKRGESERSLIVLQGNSDQFLGQLIDEVEVLARMEGVPPRSGSAFLPRKFPYQPFAEIAGSLVEDVDVSAPRFAPFASVLATFCPGTLPSAAVAASTYPALKSRQEVYRFLDLATEFFLEAARESPLLICIRNLEQAGRETIELLRSIARNVHLRRSRRDSGTDLEPTKLLIIASVRDARTDLDSESTGMTVAEALLELAPEPFAERIKLENLGLDRIPEWIRERAPQLQLEGDLVRRLYEKSDGAPWLLDEFIFSLLDAPAAGETYEAEDNPSKTLLRLPRKAEDAAYKRLERLPPLERCILEILACSRVPLSPDDVAAVVADLRQSEVSGADITLRMGWLRDRGFLDLRETERGGEAIMSQPELADLLSRQLRDEERVELHAALARRLWKEAAAGGRGRCPEDVAHHAWLGGLGDLYFSEAISAADRLAAAHACEAAAQIYEEALERLGTESVLRRNFTSSLDPDAFRRQANEKLTDIYLLMGLHQKAIEKLTFLSATYERGSDAVRLATVYRKMGEAYQQSGEPANAAYFLEKSASLLAAPVLDGTPQSDEAARGVERGRTLLSLARYQLGRDGLTEAARTLEEALEAARDGGASSDVPARTHLLKAEIETRTGHHGRALSENLEALDAAKAAESIPLRLEALVGVGWSHVGLGQNDEAIVAFEEALDAAKELQSKFDLAAILSSLGTVHHNRADHQRALDGFEQGLYLSSQIGDLKGIANGYNNVGIVYALRDDLGRAMDCYKRAIDLFSRLGDQQGMATGMNNLSSILELEGKYSEALDYSFRALEKRKKSHTRSGTAFSYYRTGKIYQSKGELEKALASAAKSLQIRVEIGDRLGIAYSSLLLAELTLSQGKYAEAIERCEAGLKDFENLDNEVGVLHAREVMARILLGVGDLGGARVLLEQVLDRSGEREQADLTAKALLSLGRVAAERRAWKEAEELIVRAEKGLRAQQNKRQILETLFEKCWCKLAAGRSREAAMHLDEAYSLLEELGIRDLVPLYFLLRGKLAEMEVEDEDDAAERARKFYERGLVESRTLSMLDLQWRLHLHKGRMDARRKDPKLARIHFQEAVDVLRDMHDSIPTKFRGAFLEVGERREASRLLDQESPTATERPAPSAEPAAAPKEMPAPEEARAPLGPTDAFRVSDATLKLHEIASAIGSEADLQKLLERIMDAVLELVDAERGFVILREPESSQEDARPVERSTFIVARNLDKEEILDPHGKVSHSVSREVILTGKPMLAGNALGESRFVSSRSVRVLKLQSILCVPLRFRGETLGVIYLDNRHRQDAFSEVDLRVLQAYGDQAAVAVMNARLIEENLRRTKDLLEANRKMEVLNAKLRHRVIVKNAQLALAKEDLKERQSQLEERYQFRNIVGRSEAMRRIFFMLERVAATPLPVLLEGESGTGKELIAHAIHFSSPQREARFVSLNCGALTESLLESELFGHTRGSFTGAIMDKKGLFELADNGTLFLDEVGDMSLAMQQKILRVLQEGEIRRVGGKDSIRVSVRVVSASNRSMKELVRSGAFREDLYYRLNGITLHVPSLRERKDDIPHLVEHFCQLSGKPDEPPRKFLPDALRALMEHDWPGNVRELRHVIDRSMLIASDLTIGAADLLIDAPTEPADAPPSLASTPIRALPEAGRGGRAAFSLREARSQAERELLTKSLDAVGGSVAAAARRCGISRESFYRLLRRHGIQPR